MPAAYLSGNNRQATLALLLFAGALLAVGLVPVDGWEALPDVCLFHRLTALPCPTCGLTRSWAALLRGQLGTSLRFHALGLPSLVAIGMVLGVERLRPRGWRIPRSLIILGAVAWTGYGLGRMFSCFPGP
jgi:hypothetical protein